MAGDLLTRTTGFLDNLISDHSASSLTCKSGDVANTQTRVDSTDSMCYVTLSRASKLATTISHQEFSGGYRTICAIFAGNIR